MTRLKVLVEVDDQMILDYSEEADDVRVSHEQRLRKVTSAEDTSERYEKDGTHHVVISYKEQPK